MKSTLFVLVVFAIFAFATAKRYFSITSYSNANCRGHSTTAFTAVTNECMKMGPLAYRKESCEGNNYKVSVCTDSNCSKCVHEVTAPNDCIDGESVRITCANQITAPSNAIARLEFFASEDGRPRCNRNNIFNTIFVNANSCSKLDESLFFKLAVRGNNGVMTFYKDGNCRSQADFSRETTIQNNRCFIPEFLPIPNVVAQVTFL